MIIENARKRTLILAFSIESNARKERTKEVTRSQNE
jgi:hypothetical protein